MLWGACTLLGLAGAVHWQLANKIQGLLRHYEAWELDEILLVAGVVALVAAIYGLRRARRLATALRDEEAAQRRFLQSELWRHLLSENLPLGLLEFEATGVIAHCNGRFRSLSGYQREELIGRPVVDFFPDLAEILPRVVGVLELDRRLRTSQGDELWVRLQISPLADVSAQISGGLILATDITQQKEHELEQGRLQERLSRIASEWKVTFDEVESPILILDEEDRIRRMNRAAKDLIGKPYTESLGLRLPELSTAEPWRSLERLVARSRRSDGSQSLQIHEDEETGRSWDLTANLVRRPVDGTSVILIARETTAMVALQKSLQHNELMSAMGALVAGVAHEVRNPLFGISATLDAFEARLGSEHPHRRFIQVLRTEVDRMGNLMTELLDYGKPLELQPSLESLRSVILEAIEHCETLIRQTGVNVRVDEKGGLPPIRMDRRHMVQVFKNLVANAIQHSPPESQIEVHLEATDDGLHRCTVRDRGKGFTEAGLERVFEPFYSERQGGVGLGLSIVQRFVLEQGGTVNAYNHEEGGAVVEVALPVRPPTPDESDSEPPSESLSESLSESAQVPAGVQTPANTQSLLS